MLYLYQHLPEKINPFVFKTSFISLRWYSVMFALAILSAYFILKIRKRNNYFLKKINEDNLLIYLTLGIIIGGRLGYVFFYDWNYFSHHLELTFLPWIKNNQGKIIFQGISGMSYHGGLMGAIIAGLFYCYKYKINFWVIADELALIIPLGYFWGRLGNFLNGELYGRVTQKFWGMYFNGESFLRHPSQLYEALGEGILLFGILWKMSKKCEKVKNNQNKSKTRIIVEKFCKTPGTLFLSYIFLYSLIRFNIEFFRQPDWQIGLVGGFLSEGQILCLVSAGIAIIVMIYLLLYANKNKKIL